LDTRSNKNKLTYDKQYFVYSKNQKVDKTDCIHEYLLPFHTSTYFFKREALDLDKLAFLTNNVLSGDILILNLLNSEGNIRYIDNVFGVKHLNPSGITNSLEHKGMSLLWNRIYMWKKIALFIYRKDSYLKSYSMELSLHFEKIYKKKLGNLSFRERISTYRSINYGKLQWANLFLKLHLKKLLN
jgi:hypothetical protein